MIHILDCGIGNLSSVANMLKKLGEDVALATTPQDIEGSRKLIMPGVGSFDAAASALRNAGVDQAIKAAVQERGMLLLGICLGMQLLFDSSEEGNLPGLGLVRGQVKRFRLDGQGLRVPHMGWNVVRAEKKSRLFDPMSDEQRFYFVHSYHAQCIDADDVSATTHYGYDFACAVERGTVMGVQFHPEKSHRFGMSLLRRFVEVGE